MKVLHILLVSLLLVASGSSFNLSYVLPNTDPWFVPNFINDTFTWITRGFVESELGKMATIPDLVDYHLYTQKNPDMGQNMTTMNSSALEQSSFNGTNPTRIIIHGFKSSAELPVCTLLRDVYLKKGPHNIICIDWSQIAQKSYPTARFVAPSVGKDLAKFINFLSSAGGMRIKNLIIIGHSLGAHVAGIAGKILKKQNTKIPVIIACDPALPLFDYNDCSSRICKNDADFVESIQTCGGRLGFLRPIGTGTYYPNGGVAQPGCGIDLIGSCSHSRSFMYLAEAIKLNDFATIKCKGYRSAVLKHCGNTYSSVMMGSTASYGVKGIFYVPVNSEPSYGKGT